MYLDFRGIELHVWCCLGMRIEIWVGVAETGGLLLLGHSRGVADEKSRGANSTFGLNVILAQCNDGLETSCSS